MKEAPVNELFVANVPKGFNSKTHVLIPCGKYTINDCLTAYGQHFRFFYDSSTYIHVGNGQLQQITTRMNMTKTFNIQDVYHLIKSVRTADGNWIAKRKYPNQKNLQKVVLRKKTRQRKVIYATEC